MTRSAAAVNMPAVDSGLLMDSRGRTVIGQNDNRLPDGCTKLSEDVQLTVHAGRAFAKFPGVVYGYSDAEWHVKPCARLTVTLINDDQVRHQWVVSGLPKELYPKGVFALEASGGEEVTGTFILPPQDRSYPVSSEVHQQPQAITSRLIVGEGDAFLPAFPDSNSQPLFSGMLVLGFVAGVLGAPYMLEWFGRRFFGMKGKELSGYLFSRLVDLTCLFVQAVTSVLQLFGLRKKPSRR